MARTTKLNHSMEGLKEVINHHIPYEIRMMRQTFVMLADGRGSLWFSQVIINALIESFSLHARSLIEFFSGQQGQADNTAAAKHFAKPNYEPCSDDGPGTDLMHKLNAQVAHPSYSRTSKDQEKLSPQDRVKLIAFIEGEIARFSAAIKETYKADWPTDMLIPILRANSDPKIDVKDPATATNQFGSWGSGPTGPLGPPRGADTFNYSSEPEPKPK